MSRALNESSTEQKTARAHGRAAALERRPPVAGVEEELNVLYREISGASIGTNTWVAGVVGKRIAVITWSCMSLVNIIIRFQNSGGANLSGQYNIPVRGGFVMPENESGWFLTATGQGFVMTSNINAPVGGFGGSMTYELRDP